MRTTFSELDQIFAAGAVRRADHPDKRCLLDRALRDGRAVAVLPGVYVPTALSDDLETLKRAVMVWDPDAVIVGRAAAAASFWPDLRRGRMTVASPHRHRYVNDRFDFVRCRIPPEFVVSLRGVRHSSAAWTAIELCLELGPTVIDRALRAKRVTPEQLAAALRLSPGRRGNLARRRQLLDAAGQPWSYLERRTHRMLRRHDLRSWRGNPAVLVAGQVYHPDVLFDDMPLVLELEGPLHRDPAIHVNDCRRQNEFAAAGYRVLRFTESDIDHREDQVMEQIFRLRRLLSR